MTPAARLQATVEILEALEQTQQPVDRFLRHWFRMRRYAGAKDRAAIGERVYAIFRYRAAFFWRMQSESPRALVLASLLQESMVPDEIAALFTAEAHAPAPLSGGERAALESSREGAPPLWVKGEFPEFLEGELRRRFADRLLDEMAALRGRAPVDLRANTLRATREEVLAALQAGGLDCLPTEYSPCGIRLWDRTGAQGLSRTPCFIEGRFEFQDEAAQIASLLGAARPCERVLDLAAGAGGKALALAAQMKNKGVIIAYDTDAARLAQLRPRAERAGATIIEERFGDLPQAAFDAVFVDASCSGSGTWRRQPELKWRLTPERLAQLRAQQAEMLDTAASLRPGRIVYATCSLLPSENEDQVEAFLARHRDYTRGNAAETWRDVTGEKPPPGMNVDFHASPFSTGTDGFYAAILVRVDNA